MQDLLSSLGPLTAIIGAQWGDEGKGKGTHMLAEHFDVIARGTGGANAGHTVVVNGEKFVFHLLPSGALYPDKPLVLGAGMVIHLSTLLEEIAVVENAGIDVIPRMYISPAAHIVFDFHKDIDAKQEEERAAKAGQGIGTTKRGIGPAYTDKAQRVGIRMEHLQNDIKQMLIERRDRIEKQWGVDIDELGEIVQLHEAQEKLADRVIDPIPHMHQWREEGKTMIIEGAQATHLDIDHGTYPYVTSGSTTASGTLQGLGLPPSSLTSCIGVVKAYCTRVGSGPFLTEADEEASQRLRDRGGEYGATTGRPRRCGWLHIPDILRANMINGFTHWNLTKLDVLDEEETILVGAEEKHGEPVYEEMPGWNISTAGMTNVDDLPKEAKSYIAFIEEKTGIPVSLIGTGQGSEEMIVQ